VSSIKPSNNSEVSQQQENLSPDMKEKPPYEMRYRWVMLALIWFIYCTFGAVQRVLAPLVTPIMEDLKLSFSQMGVIMGAWPLTYIIVAAIAGAIIDRWGIRRSLFVGILAIGLSAVLRYFVTGFTSLFLCVALFGLGGPMISIGSPKTISMWFSGKGRATAVGIYMTGPWIGALTAYAVTNSVVMPLTGYSWRLTFVCFGLLAFAAALLWWFLARDIKETAVTVASTSITKVFSGLITIRNIQLLLIMGFLSFAINHGFGNWLPQILETGGLPPAIAGYAASIPILIGIPSVLIVPRLVASGTRGRFIALMSLIVSISLFTIITGSGALRITGLLVYGLSSGIIMPLIVLILMEIPEVGSKYMGAAAGMFFCVAEIGGFAGPFLIGAIKDFSGSFLTGGICLAGIALAMAVIALFIRIKPTPGAPASS
jgi:cyanate permease